MMEIKDFDDIKKEALITITPGQVSKMDTISTPFGNFDFWEPRKRNLTTRVKKITISKRKHWDIEYFEATITTSTKGVIKCEHSPDWEKHGFKGKKFCFPVRRATEKEILHATAEEI